MLRYSLLITLLSIPSATGLAQEKPAPSTLAPAPAKHSPGAELAAKVREILDLNVYATRFFLGNMRLYPNAFTIVGLWYPKKTTKKAPTFW